MHRSYTDHGYFARYSSAATNLAAPVSPAGGSISVKMAGCTGPEGPRGAVLDILTHVRREQRQVASTRTLSAQDPEASYFQARAVDCRPRGGCTVSYFFNSSARYVHGLRLLGKYRVLSVQILYFNLLENAQVLHYRQLLTACLSNKQEISDDLMSAMSTLLTSNVPSEADSAQQKAFVTYSYPLHSADDSTSEQAVTLLEARSVISGSGTTGLRTWEAAILLGSYLSTEDGRRVIEGKRVFELGAGTGVISILCAKHLGASGVVATDGDEAVVDAIKTNLFLNGLDTDSPEGCQVRTAALKWGWPVDGTAFSEDYGMEVPSVLLGADVVSASS